jgi:hypothetical protein
MDSTDVHTLFQINMAYDLSSSQVQSMQSEIYLYSIGAVNTKKRLRIEIIKN